MLKHAGINLNGASSLADKAYGLLGRLIGPGFASPTTWRRHFNRVGRFNKTIKDLGTAEALLAEAKKRGATLSELAPLVDDVEQLKRLNKNLASTIQRNNIRAGRRALNVTGAGLTGAAGLGLVDSLTDDSEEQGKAAALEALAQQNNDRRNLYQAQRRRAEEQNSLRAKQRDNVVNQQKNTQEANWLEDTRLLATGGLGLVGGGIGAAVDRRNRLRGFLLGSLIGAGAGGLAAVGFDKLTEKPKEEQF